MSGKETAGESWYKTLIDNLPQRIFFKDRNLVYLVCNKNYADDLKIKPHAIKGKTDFEFYPKDLAEKYRADDKDVMDAGKVKNIEEKYIQDGEEVFVNTIKVPIRDESGDIIGVLGIFWDITARKQMEQALKENEERLSSMLQSITDHMSMMDNDLNIIWANDVAKSIFGSDIVGKKCYEVYHRRDNPCEPYPCLTLKAFQDGEIHEHDTEVIDKDGRKIYFHCIANVALRDKDGNPGGVLEISRDISERKRSEESLMAKLEEIERLNRHMLAREMRVMEIKREVNGLLEELGREPRYRV